VPVATLSSGEIETLGSATWLHADGLEQADVSNAMRIGCRTRGGPG